jgi:S1-C subfamily serine protease
VARTAALKLGGLRRLAVPNLVVLFFALGSAVRLTLAHRRAPLWGFTLGNVSALVGIGEDGRYLQISTPVQPGNSGGPLLDQSGNVVGVVSAKLNALKMMLATNGDIPENVSFAIRASIVTKSLTQKPTREQGV